MSLITILQGIENMLALMESRVNIGINPQSDSTVRHGVLWTIQPQEDGTTKSVLVPLVLDRPKVIKDGLNYATWNRLRKQIAKMGITATHMELQYQDQHLCYTLDRYNELYAKRSVGRPQYRLGIS